MAGDLTFTDADTEFIVTPETASVSGDITATAILSLLYSDPDGQEKTADVSLNLPRLGDGYGIRLADALRDFFPLVDFSRAGKCFFQDCSVTIKDITYAFYDSAGTEIDSGGVVGYNAVFIFDPGQHGYADIYRQERFLQLSSFVPVRKNGIFAFSYMQKLAEKTSVYLISDGQEELLAEFDHVLYGKYFYNIAGRFYSATARVEIRNTDTGAVLAAMNMSARDEQTYDEHTLYLASPMGTPELFVFTGFKNYDAKVDSDIFETLRRAALSDASASRSITVNSGYIDEDEYERLVSFFPVLHECSVDGTVCFITGADLNFTHGQKNNVSITFRPKWN